ncbi:MAG: hypothetical protein NTW29_19410 [Bacteroidetes bacterium]|nr:hypothetical protein [Bacteroidota bacterium]
MPKSTVNQQEIYFSQLSDSKNLNYSQCTYVVIKGNLYADLYKKSIKSSKNVFADVRNKSFSNYTPFVSLRKSNLSGQITKADSASGLWSTASVSKYLQDGIHTSFEINVNDRCFSLNANGSELHLKSIGNDAACSETQVAFSFCDFVKKTKFDIFLKIAFPEYYFTNSAILLKEKRLITISDQA